jgi:V8-like Glu-specific endopeptidase
MNTNQNQTSEIRFNPSSLLNAALTTLIDNDMIYENEWLVKRLCLKISQEKDYIHACNIWICDDFGLMIEVYDTFNDRKSILRFVDMFKTYLDLEDDCLDIGIPLRISLPHAPFVMNLFEKYRNDSEMLLNGLLELSAIQDEGHIKDLTTEGIEPNPGPIYMRFYERELVEGVDWNLYPVLTPEMFSRFSFMIPQYKRFDLYNYPDIKIEIEFVAEHSREMFLEYASQLFIAYSGDPSETHFIKCKFPRVYYWWFLKNHDIHYDPRCIIQALLLRAGVESNPGPITLNGNTKRDSKTHRSEETTTFENKDKYSDAKKQQRYKRHIRALDSEMKHTLKTRHDDEFDEFLKPQGFPSLDFKAYKGFSVELKMDLLTDLFNQLKNVLQPKKEEYKVLLGHLSTLIIVMRSDDWLVRASALVANWPNLGDQMTSIYALCILADAILNWFRNGDLNAPWYNKKQVPEEIRAQALNTFEGMFDIAKMKPIQAIGALILSVCSLFLLNKIPGKGDYDSFMRRCEITMRGCRGISALYETMKSYVSSAVVYCEEVATGQSPTLLISIEDRLDKICEAIKNASTIPNREKLLTHRSQVELVDSLFKQSLEMIDTLRLGGLPAQKQAFLAYFHVIRELHKAASVSPISGRGFRQAPKFFQLAGKPGVGKTRLAWVLSIDFLRELGLNEEQMKEYASYIYFRKTGEKYWTNYNAEMHKICVCDDASQLFEEHGEGVPFFAEIIHLANNAECPLSVAEVDLKKFARFNSQVIISTDNNRNPNLNNILRDPAAFRRRIDLQVEVKVKPEFGDLYSDRGQSWYRLKPDLCLSEELRTDVYIFDITDPVSGKIIHENLTYDQLFTKMKIGLMQNHKEFINFGSALHKYALRGRPSDVPHDEDLVRVQGISEYFPQIFRNSPSGSSYSEILGNPFSNPFSSGFQFPDMPRISTSDATCGAFNFIKNHRWTIAASFVVLVPSLCYVIYNYMYPKRQWKRQRKHEEPLSYEEDGQRWYEVPGVRKFRYQIGWSEDQIFEAVLDIAEDFDRLDAQYDGFYDDLHNLSQWFDGHFKLVEPGENVDDLFTFWSRVATESKSRKQKPRMNKIVQILQEYNREDPKKATKKQDKTKAKQTIRVETSSKFHSKEKISLAEAYTDSNSTEYFKQKVYYNLYRVVAGSAGFSNAMHLLFIKGRVAVTARHLLYDTRLPNQKAYITIDNANIAAPYKIPMEEIRVLSLPNDDSTYKDLVFLVFPDKVHQHKDITSMFNTRQELENLGAIQAQLTCYELFGVASKLDMFVNMKFVVDGKPKTEKLRSLADDGTIITYTDYFEYLAETFPGCCGAPIMALDARQPKKILGIHIAGKTGTGYAQAISYEEVEAVLSEIRPQCLVSAPSIDSIGTEKLEIPHSMMQSGYYPLGTVTQAVFTAKQSQISESPIHGLVTEPMTKPANLDDFEHNGEKVNLDFNMDKYFGKNDVFIPDEDLEILENYGVQCFAIDDENQYLMRKLTYDESIRGIPGEDLPSMNRQTSPGYPYTLTKKGMGKTQWLGKEGEFDVDNEELKTDVTYLIDQAAQGIREPVVFTALFKDERRPIAKVDQGKTRIFAGGPMHFTIAIRMFYLGFCAVFMRQRIRNGSLVGADVHSQDWTTFVKYLNQVADVNEPNFLAGDHSNFDGSLNLQLLWVVYRIIERLYKRVDNLTTYVLWSSICNSVLLFKKVLYMLTHSQPSGNPLTTVINTMYDEILFFYVLLLLLREIIRGDDEEAATKASIIIKKITDHFRMGGFGDDLIAVLSHDLRSLITPDDITQKMLSLGHKFTDEAKSDGKQVYRTLHEVSLLKRKFVYEPTMSRWLAPLELSVILEMLNWDKCKTKQEKYEQLSTNIQTACVEFVYHGKEVYTKWTQRIQAALVEQGLEGKVKMPLMAFSDFQEMVYRRGVGLKSNFENFLPV